MQKKAELAAKQAIAATETATGTAAAAATAGIVLDEAESLEAAAQPLASVVTSRKHARSAPKKKPAADEVEQDDEEDEDEEESEDEEEVVVNTKKRVASKNKPKNAVKKQRVQSSQKAIPKKTGTKQLVKSKKKLKKTVPEQPVSPRPKSIAALRQKEARLAPFLAFTIKKKQKVQIRKHTHYLQCHGD